MESKIVKNIYFAGEVIDVEGSGADRKAKVRFENGGEKTLILRFAKFKVL